MGTLLAAIRGRAIFQATSEGSTADTPRTALGYSATFSPEPKPISITSPDSPAHTRLRKSRTAGLRLLSTRRGTTCSCHQPILAPSLSDHPRRPGAHQRDRDSDQPARPGPNLNLTLSFR